jgi:hypothetical protein
MRSSVSSVMKKKIIYFISVIIFTCTFVTTVVKSVVIALTKIVPTNDPSGINPYEPAFPNMEISSRSLLSNSYPKPKVLIVHVKLVFFFNFSSVGK